MTWVLRIAVACLAVVSQAGAILYNNTANADFIDKWCNPKKEVKHKPEGYDPIERYRWDKNAGKLVKKEGDCQQMTCWGIKEATGGFHFLPDRERADEEWERIKKEGSCKEAGACPWFS